MISKKKDAKFTFLKMILSFLKPKKERFIINRKKVYMKQNSLGILIFNMGTTYL
jgi:hypothetical protein